MAEVKNMNFKITYGYFFTIKNKMLQYKWKLVKLASNCINL